MRELSLFTGAGGGLLGTKLLGWTHVGYVEFNEYCQQVIRQRIEDGILDEAPIFTDVREFLQSGAAEQYRGIADVVTAGFPCQPFSVAGKGLGEDDPRNMWSSTINVIRAVRPENILLENVPGLLANEYIRTIFRDLAESGFYPKWDCLGASDVGGKHKRKRLWFVSNSNGFGRKGCAGGAVNNEAERGIQQGGEARRALEAYFVANSTGEPSYVGNNYGEYGECSESEFRDSLGTVGPDGEFRIIGFSSKPFLRRRIDDVANRVERIKALGNGQVPAVVATAWRLLTSE